MRKSKAVLTKFIRNVFWGCTIDNFACWEVKSLFIRMLKKRSQSGTWSNERERFLMVPTGGYRTRRTCTCTGSRTTLRHWFLARPRSTVVDTHDTKWCFADYIDLVVLERRRRQATRVPFVCMNFRLSVFLVVFFPPTSPLSFILIRSVWCADIYHGNRIVGRLSF